MHNRTQKPLSICLVNYDWRNIYQSDKNELHEKLERDMLSPNVNTFYFFSWAHLSYRSDDGKWKTTHKKTHGLEKLRPILNLLTILILPIEIRRMGLKVDLWASYDFGMTPALWVCKKLYGGSVVGILNNQPKIYSETRKFGRMKGWYSWVAERIGVRLVDHMFTINETLKEYIISLGCPADKITIFSMNTILRDSKHIPAARRGLIREQYKVPKHAKVLITVARLEAEKNWPRSLELFASLPKDHYLFCVSMGSMEQELKNQAKELGVEERVFFTGFIQRKDIWNYYKDADVFVLLSKAEALGIVFWEAMYVGLPVIGSDVEGIVESVGQDGDRGRIWKESDGVAGYQERVRFCLTPSNDRDAMVGRAKDFVDQKIKNLVTINDIPHTS
jgi:glycosyltransferase involved in cell wall biosynthesis